MNIIVIIIIIIIIIMFSARPTTNRIGLAVQKSIQYKQHINSWDTKNVKEMSPQMTLESSSTVSRSDLKHNSKSKTITERFCRNKWPLLYCIFKLNGVLYLLAHKYTMSLKNGHAHYAS